MIYETTDGFEIARQDLADPRSGRVPRRAPVGRPLLRFADLERDAELIEAAREAAEWLLAAHPDAARRHIERWLGARADYLNA